MNVRTVCLAILNFKDATGYEIRKLSAEGSLSHFIDASFGAIYPALARMETEGLVTARIEPQPGKPPRKVYSITESGRAELLAALSAPMAPDTYRSEFLLVAICAEALPPDVVAAALDRRCAQLEEEITHLSSLAHKGKSPPAQWAVNYGIACKTAALDYLRAHRQALVAASGTGRSALPADCHDADMMAAASAPGAIEPVPPVSPVLSEVQSR